MTDKQYLSVMSILTCKTPNTTIAEFANSVDPDEKAHIEPSHLDLQCLPSSFLLFFFNIKQYKSFSKFCRRNFVVCFFGALRVKDAVINFGVQVSVHVF